jgi:alkaline phosphatase
VATHPIDRPDWVPLSGPVEEQEKSFWNNKAQNTLKDKLNQKLNTNIAKNIIVFIGDGMGFSTTMASRVYMKDVNSELSFEKFPYTGHSKVLVKFKLFSQKVRIQANLI